MRVNIDSKVLVNKVGLIKEYTEELQTVEFKISQNEWGDLNIVKFENIKVELKYTDRVLDKRKSKSRGEVAIKSKTKKKFLANDIIISNKHIYFIDAEVKKIQIDEIIQIEMYDNYLDIITRKERFGIVANSLRFNIHFITMLEWISTNKIDDKYIGKKIKFKSGC